MFMIRCWSSARRSSRCSSRRLPLGDVDVDAAVTNRRVTTVPDHSSAAENQPNGPIGPTDAVLAVIRVSMALHRFAVAVVYPLAVLVQAQAAQHAHRHGLVRRLQSHDAKELLGPLNRVGRHIDIPDADPSQFLGHPEQHVPFRQLLLQSPPVANVSHEYREPAGTRIDVQLDWRAGDE